MIRGRRLLTALVLFVFILPCTGLPAEEILVGAGATFPGPLYEEWISQYQKKTGVKIRYEGVGSSKGIRALTSREVDFGGTDIFLSDEQIKNEQLSVLHVPTCMGAVAVTYNLPDMDELKLPPDTLARIFLGRIDRWSAREIADANPGRRLPDMAITIVHRSDGSGTNYVLTDYLAKVSPEWLREVGVGEKVKWKAGLGVEKNGGVLETVKRIPGSIGYVSLNYAEENNMPVASIRNRSGRYIKPTSVSVTSSVTEQIPADTRTLITDTPALNGYPISTFTYLIVHKEQAYQNRSRARALELARFLRWCIHDGQASTRKLYFAPLPETVIGKVDNVISSMTYNGEKFLK